MKRNQTDVLETCINKLERGSSVEECFYQYPDMTEETRAMLRTIAMLRLLSEEPVPSEAMSQSRMNMLAQARSMEKDRVNGSTRSPGYPQNWFQRLVPRPISLTPIASRVGLILGITFLLVLLSGGLVITSAKSLPGDSLYPVKIAVEDLSIHLILNQEVRNEYEISYGQQRVEEVRRLLALQRSQQISFEGVVQSIENNDFWQVDGIRVQVTTGTNYIGGFSVLPLIEPGVVVEVEGQTSREGWVQAHEIHLRQYQLQGKVEVISGEAWTIAGNQIGITTNTLMDPGIKTGDVVLVKVQSTDTALVAVSIHLVRQTSATPGIEPTEAEPQPTGAATSGEETPEATNVASPEATSISTPEAPESVSTTDTIQPQVTPGGDHESEYQMPTTQATPYGGEREGADNPISSQTPEAPDQH